MRIAYQSDLIALVPRQSLNDALIAGEPGMADLVGFALPVHTAEIAVSAMWHPRLQADPAHRWLRHIVLTVCRDPAQQ